MGTQHVASDWLTLMSHISALNLDQNGDHTEREISSCETVLLEFIHRLSIIKLKRFGRLIPLPSSSEM
jgi:hypothetical protein